jgi:hypothetical protein
MRKVLLFAVVVASAAVLYSVFSDPEKRERVLGTIEDSTGVDLESGTEKIIKDTGRAVGKAAERMLNDLGDALSDPEFHQSLERWGKNALEKLDSADLERFRDELEQESGFPDRDYDAIFEKYLGEADNS